jgi:hypothetical protein
MQTLLTELDTSNSKVQDSRKDIINRIDSLIGELNNAKQNITKSVSHPRKNYSLECESIMLIIEFVDWWRGNTTTDDGGCTTQSITEERIGK